jgi:hypothetical protein
MLPLIPLAIAGAAVGFGYCYYRGSCAHHAKRQVKEEVTRWEAEGGNVPEVDTPTPQVKPQTSQPATPYEGSRH